VKRIRIILISLLVCGIGGTVVHAASWEIQQGAFLWSATARFDSYLRTHEADAPWYGVKLEALSPSAWWLECSFASGEEDYTDAVDTIYARELQFLGGFGTGFLSMGIGAIWMSEDFRGSLPPYNAWGFLSTVSGRLPLGSDALTAVCTAKVQPMVFGSNPLPREFIDLFAGLEGRIGRLMFGIGYRARYHYNYDSDWRVSGVEISLRLLAGGTEDEGPSD